MCSVWPDADCRALHLLRPPCRRGVKGWISDHGVKRAVVVGGGFIGLEMVENLVHMGIHVTLVEMLPQVNQGLGCTSHLKGTARGEPGPCMLLHSPHHLTPISL